MTTVTIEQLREAVTEIDCMSQTAFSEIAAFAKLALNLLEEPLTYQDPEILACVLKSIWGQAKDTENHINCMADSVDASHKDKSIHRRFDAVSKARATALNGGA